jgi:hypothetical protein
VEAGGECGGDGHQAGWGRLVEAGFEGEVEVEVGGECRGDGRRVAVTGLVGIEAQDEWVS